MAVHGFVTHAAANRRKLRWLVVSYIAAFQLLCAFALILLLVLYDPGNTIITNPLGYAIRYAVPVGIIAYLLFRLFYSGHLKHVQRKLNVWPIQPGGLNNADEKRLLRVADPVCIAIGLRQPQFGIIDAAEPNALAVGATRDSGLIAVTRGLLHQLDDEELAAVIAHEAAHIRNGDTQINAANHALMRTAVNIQVNNPLRLDSWQPLMIVLALPFFLPLLLAGNAATMLAMQLSFQARRGIAESRDYIADGEAVRITQFPDALISALRKVGDHGAFRDSEHFRLMLFAGGKSAEGEKLPCVAERIKNIEGLSGAMLDSARVRRDTRIASDAPAKPPRAAKFGAALRKHTPTPPPPPPTLFDIWERPGSWTEWHEHCVDYYQWRESDQRNAFGLTAKTFLPLAFTLTFLVIFHWPTHGTFLGAIQIFNPANLVAGFETPDGGINFFQYAGEEASKKQNVLTLIVVLFALLASIIPGVRERVYPHVDWKAVDRQRTRVVPLMAFAQSFRRREKFGDRLERELDELPKDPTRDAMAGDLPVRVSIAVDVGIKRELERLAPKPQPVATPPVPPLQPVGLTPRSSDMTHRNDEEQREPLHRQLFDAAKEIAIDEMVGSLTDDWLGYEADDDERPARGQGPRRETFNERLERELAGLPKNADRNAGDGDLPASLSSAFDESIKRELERIAAEQQQPAAPPVHPLQAVAPVPLPIRPLTGPRGFGRKVA